MSYGSEALTDPTGLLLWFTKVLCIPNIAQHLSVSRSLTQVHGWRVAVGDAVRLVTGTCGDPWDDALAIGQELEHLLVI